MKRLRRLRDTATLLKQDYDIDLKYWKLKELYYSGIVKGFRIGKTIYVYYDDVIKVIVK